MSNVFCLFQVWLFWEYDECESGSRDFVWYGGVGVGGRGGVVCGLRMGVGVGGPGSRVEGVVCSRGNVSVAGGRAR